MDSYLHFSVIVVNVIVAVVICDLFDILQAPATRGHSAVPFSNANVMIRYQGNK